MIRGRFSRGQREERDGGTSTAEAPLFNLDEIYERRILSWSPELDNEVEAADPEGSDDVAPADSARPEPEVADIPPAQETEVPATRAPEPLALATAPAPPAPAPRTAPAPAPQAETPAGHLHPEPAETTDGPTETAQPAKRRGRPRGRPRRQVHFHVDPDEERLLMKAVETFGSQQKALVAGLEALQEAESLRREIEDLRHEAERQRELLAKAESLFSNR